MVDYLQGPGRKGDKQKQKRALILLGALRTQMGIAGQQVGKLKKILADGTVIKVWRSYGLEYYKIIAPGAEEITSEFIFSAEWKYGEFIYGSTPDIDERNRYYKGSEWGIKKRNNILIPDYYFDYGMANWFSTDGKTILSWNWGWDDSRNRWGSAAPYNFSAYTNVLLFEGDNELPVFEDAPSPIIGACKFHSKYVCATTDGIYYRDGDSWILVSGTDTLFDDLIYSGSYYAPVRFSGSGEQGVSVLYVYEEDVKKLTFSLGYNDISGEISLAGSSLETAYTASNVLGSWSESSSSTDTGCIITEYSPPEDPPDPVCDFLPGDSIGRGENYTDALDGCTGIAGPFIEQIYKYCITPSVLYNQINSWGMTATTQRDITGNDSYSASASPTEVLYAADWDVDNDGNEVLVEAYINTGSFSNNYSDDASDTQTHDFLSIGTPPDYNFGDTYEIYSTYSQTESITRNFSYNQSLKIKKDDSLVLDKPIINVSGAFNGAYTTYREDAETTIVINNGTGTITDRWNGSSFRLFGMDLRSQELLGISLDTNFSGDGSYNTSLANPSKGLRDIIMNWSAPILEVITPDGTYAKELDTNYATTSENNTVEWSDTNYWASTATIYSSGGVILWGDLAEPFFMTYYSGHTTTPNGDILFSIDSGGLWYGWTNLGYFYDALFLPNEIEPIVAVQGIFDSKTKQIIPLSEVHPGPFVDADGNEVYHSFMMTSYYGDNTIPYVGYGSWMMTHKNT